MANLEELVTRGALKALASGQQLHSSTFAQPVVQVLSHRKVSGGGPTRYRLTVTDGEQCSVAMLGMGLNHMVEEDRLPCGAVLRITSYVPAGKITFIIIALDVLGVCARIGLDSEEQKGSVALSPATAQAQLPQSQLPQVQPTPLLPSASTATSGAGGSSGRRGLDTSRVRPISSLNPYQTCWTICGRVTQKSQMRNWTNRRGQGHLFSFALSDDTGSVRVTAFEAEADRHFDMVEIGRPLYVSRGRVKAANRQFNTTDNEYEMQLTSESQMQPCDEASCAMPVPELKFNFVPISQLASVEPNSLVDICGVAHETHDCQTIRGRASGRQVTKRDLLLVDASGWAVRCTLWGQEAADFGSQGAADAANKPVLAIRAAKVSDFGGRSLSVAAGSCLMVEPARLPEACRLRAWYRQRAGGRSCAGFASYGRELGGGGSSAPYRDLGSCSSLLGLGTGRAASQQVFRCFAVPDCIRKETCLYRACPKSDCNKKVAEYNGQYWCEKCQATYPAFEWRYMLSVDLADFSGNRWATCFQDAAEKLLGVSADHMGQLRAAELDSDGQADSKRTEELLARALYRLYVFTLRVRMEPFQDELRQRIVVQDVEPLGDYVEASRQLIGQIEAATAKWRLRAEI